MGFMLFQQLEFFFNLLLLGFAGLVMIFGYFHSFLVGSGTLINTIINSVKTTFNKDAVYEPFSLDSFKYSVSYYVGVFFLLMTLTKFAIYLACTFFGGLMKMICPCCFEKEIKKTPDDKKTTVDFLNNERTKSDDWRNDKYVLENQGVEMVDYPVKKHKHARKHRDRILDYDDVDGKVVTLAIEDKKHKSRKGSKDSVDGYYEENEIENKKTRKAKSLSDDESEEKSHKKRNRVKRSATEGQIPENKRDKYKKGKSLDDDNQLEDHKSKKKLKDRAMSADELQSEGISRKKSKKIKANSEENLDEDCEKPRKTKKSGSRKLKRGDAVDDELNDIENTEFTPKDDPELNMEHQENQPPKIVPVLPNS